jgi:transcription antitermination protein NusB
MQMLYQWELGGNTPEQVCGSFFGEHKSNPEVETFARGLFQGAVDDVQNLDRLLQKHSANWRLNRMAAVDRSILRMAAFELLHNQETPPGAVINEALEIARRYSSEGSVEFINGILDTILKALPGPKK